MESVNARQRPSFSFPELWYSLLEFSSRKNRQIWRIEQDGKSALKFEAERTYFLSDVLGRGIHLAKGATIFFEHYNELPLSCTTFLTTFVRNCTSVHKNRFTTCAVFLSFHVNFVHIFPQPACLDSITFPAVCAFVVLSTLIKKIRENRSVKNALKRNRPLERRDWQARRIAQVWREKMLTLSSKISRYRTTPSLRTQMYFRSSLPSTRKKRRPEIRLRSQQEWFAGYTTPVTAW